MCAAGLVRYFVNKPNVIHNSTGNRILFYLSINYVVSDFGVFLSLIIYWIYRYFEKKKKNREIICDRSSSVIKFRAQENCEKHFNGHRSVCLLIPQIYIWRSLFKHSMLRHRLFCYIWFEAKHKHSIAYHSTAQFTSHHQKRETLKQIRTTISIRNLLMHVYTYILV